MCSFPCYKYCFKNLVLVASPLIFVFFPPNRNSYKPFIAANIGLTKDIKNIVKNLQNILMNIVIKEVILETIQDLT